MIDCIQYRVGNSKLLHFLKENSHSNIELQLIRFWSRHPRAKLSLCAIACALDMAKINLRDAIKALVAKGILQEQTNGNGLITYSLSDRAEVQECVEELTKLDWREIKILEHQLDGEAVLA
jgi:predicted DNA-binding transcriptional regulator